MGKEELKELLDDINRRFFHTENAYFVRRELYLHFNIAVNEETAIAYRKVINDLKGFFMPVLESALSYYMIGINQLVNSNDKKSLEKYINLLQVNGCGDYRKELAELRAGHRKTLISYADMRMGHFAHAGDIDLNNVEPISEDGHITLFNDIRALLDRINLDIFGDVIWHQKGDARESVKDTQDLMSNLLRGEKVRVDEIDVEYMRDVYESGRTKWFSEHDE